MRDPGDLALLACAAAAIIGMGAWVAFRRRITPEERERIRRLTINRNGRMWDGNITDVNGDSIYYSYKVRGVEYMASQDVSALHNQLPSDPSVLIGPVTVKYLPTKPVESILICEEWSGFRKKESNNP